MIGNLCRIELSPIIEDHHSSNNKVGDDLFPDKLPDLSRGDESDDLCFDPLCEVVHRDKEVLLVDCALGNWS